MCRHLARIESLMNRNSLNKTYKNQISSTESKIYKAKLIFNFYKCPANFYVSFIIF